METEVKNPQSFCEKTFDEFLARLQEHEIVTSTKYVLVKSPKTFNLHQVPTSSQKIYWQDDMPYYHFGSRTYHCHRGKDRHVNDKRKYAEERDKKALEDHSFIKRYKQTQKTKKLDCPASITVSRVIRIPEHKLCGSLSRHYEQVKVSKIIKRKIQDGESVGEEGFIFNLPSVETHANHFIGESAAVTEPVDSQKLNENNENTTLYKELPLRGSNRRHLINDCKSKLRSLQSVLWTLEEDQLESLSRKLKDVCTSTISKVSVDEGSGLPDEVVTDNTFNALKEGLVEELA